VGKRSIGIIALVAIIFLAIGVGGTYLFQQLTLNDDLESNVEFNRLYFKAMEEYNKGISNEGFARAYYTEADYCFEYNLFNWGEIYYNYSHDYFNYAKDRYEKAILFLKQAKNYITNDNIIEYVDTYLDLINVTKERVIIDSIMTDYLKLACYYYNLSDWTAGDEKLENSNEYIDDLEIIINNYMSLLNEIENLLKTDWNK